MNKSKLEKQTGLKLGRSQDRATGMFCYYLFEDGDRSRTPLYNTVGMNTSQCHQKLHDEHWSFIRGLVLERDNQRCTNCSYPGGLDVHHVVPRGQGANNWDMTNLTSLCRACHDKIHFTSQKVTYVR